MCKIRNARGDVVALAELEPYSYTPIDDSDKVPSFEIRILREPLSVLAAVCGGCGQASAVSRSLVPYQAVQALKGMVRENGLCDKCHFEAASQPSEGTLRRRAPRKTGTPSKRLGTVQGR
jgi:hypothetical protein